MSYTSVTIFDANLRRSQRPAVTLLEAAVGRGRVANAYLFTGRKSQDKAQLAKELAAYLNCQGTRREALGSCLTQGKRDSAECCQNCAWISGDAHPKAWFSLKGEGKSGKVTVEKVRALVDELGLTSPYVRVIVVPEADAGAFHRPAANALLKAIEEPPENCLFLLFAASAEDVLSTIVSRCQVLPVAEPLKLGHWGGESQAMAALRADLISLSRRAFSQSQAGPRANPVKQALESAELSQKLMHYLKELSDQASDEEALSLPEQLIDQVIAADLEVLSSQAATNRDSAAYLKKLLALAEDTKRQIESYVKPANAIDYFCLSLQELRCQFRKEVHLANR